MKSTAKKVPIAFPASDLVKKGSFTNGRPVTGVFMEAVERVRIALTGKFIAVVL